MFISSKTINTLEEARAYLKRRAVDAVECYSVNKRIVGFQSPIELAKFLAKYW